MYVIQSGRVKIGVTSSEGKETLLAYHRTRGVLKQRGSRFVIVSRRGLEQDV